MGCDLLAAAPFCGIQVGRFSKPCRLGVPNHPRCTESSDTQVRAHTARGTEKGSFTCGRVGGRVGELSFMATLLLDRPVG